MAARANNKYTSINFNHILHKDPPSSSSSSSSSPYSSNSSPASYSSVARSNGRMLVLTKPSPKPLRSPSPVTTTTTPITTPSLSPAPKISDQAISDPDPNQISLRPLGHTGPGSSLSFPVRTPEKVQDVPAPMMSMSPKPDKFVPPHLRPGFVRKDEKPRLDPNPNLNQRLPNQEQGYFGYGQTGRPKSGGYERIRTDPRSTGNRPGTSG
ncbi:PREDICTED: putative protein TPRXL [Camelina sativa]|uniref:Uncharacterized protein n=1 Tax=Camelina sativa TaxID=90675 RepID=A0ABM0YQ52_CAMSA|nr:PREDICTED: putative protein TPRXL [Camelina sativa]